MKLVRERVDPWYLAYCLNSPRCYEQAQLFTRGATNQDLGLGRMKQIEIPVPPTLAEQGAVVAQLDRETDLIRQAIDRAHREVDLMREYRVRLVSDVVTGQLDVRDAARGLPDVVDSADVAMSLTVYLDEVGNPTLNAPSRNSHCRPAAVHAEEQELVCVCCDEELDEDDPGLLDDPIVCSRCLARLADD